VLDKIPTKREAAGFGCKRLVDDSCYMMTCTPEDVEGYANPISEAVGEVTWVGSHGAAKRHWVSREYGEYFGEQTLRWWGGGGGASGTLIRDAWQSHLSRYMSEIEQFK
jgi:hypothetical protein